MNKSQLSDKIGAGADISKAAAGRGLDAMMAAETESLNEGEDVALVGCGTFAGEEGGGGSGRNQKGGREGTREGGEVPSFEEERRVGGGGGRGGGGGG
ncbi:HU family DNA-binding protein, partial [Escherichia coli]|uniref:HU family DNA-binding protein n=1 Tax=Escherichia coli TaxID=562 RepID=UPI0010CBFB87